MIDLRSDTASKPTPAMREAIAGAEVGDEQLREDPTVNELERRAAEALGQEDSVFVPTATMANEIALRVLGEPGDELIAEENSHILVAELGGPAVHAGLMTRPLQARAGRFTPGAGARRGPARRPRARADDADRRDREHAQRLRRPGLAARRDRGDGGDVPGARALRSTSTARGSSTRPSRAARRRRRSRATADTVTICFSKGLGCPLGAIVAGSSERMLRARRYKHQFGGAMRQAGIVAAACVYALDHHVERLAEDHARARRLGERLHEAGVPVDLEQVETNFVQIDVGALGLQIGDALERLARRGRPRSRRRCGRACSARSRTSRSRTTTSSVASEAIPRALGVAALSASPLAGDEERRRDDHVEPDQRRAVAQWLERRVGEQAHADKKCGAADGSQLDRAERQRERVDRHERSATAGIRKTATCAADESAISVASLIVAPIRDDDGATVLGCVADDRDDDRGDEEVA